MPKLMIEVDTEGKVINASVDGNKIDNFSSANVMKTKMMNYDTGAMEDEVCFGVSTYKEENGVRTYQSICAHNKDGKLKESDIPGMFIEKEETQTEASLNNFFAKLFKKD